VIAGSDGGVEKKFIPCGNDCLGVLFFPVVGERLGEVVSFGPYVRIELGGHIANDIPRKQGAFMRVDTAFFAVSSAVFAVAICVRDVA
jgi:hypothetical protein